MDMTWLKEAEQRSIEFKTLETEKGQELFNRLWLKPEMRPTSKKEWDELLEETREFCLYGNPKDVAKIGSRMEAVYIMASCYR